MKRYYLLEKRDPESDGLDEDGMWLATPVGAAGSESLWVSDKKSAGTFTEEELDLIISLLPEAERTGFARILVIPGTRPAPH